MSALFNEFPRDDFGGMIADQWKYLQETGLFDTDEGSVINTSEEIYEVPAGKQYYLFGVYLSAVNTATLAAGAQADIKTQGDNLIMLKTGRADDSHANFAITYPQPILLNAADTITIISNKADFAVHGGAMGVEIG